MQNSAGFIFCILVIYMHSPLRLCLWRHPIGGPTVEPQQWPSTVSWTCVASWLVRKKSLSSLTLGWLCHLSLECTKLEHRLGGPGIFSVPVYNLLEYFLSRFQMQTFHFALNTTFSIGFGDGSSGIPTPWIKKFILVYTLVIGPYTMPYNMSTCLGTSHYILVYDFPESI